VNEADQQIIVELLIAVEDKAEQIEIDGPGFELLEPKHRIVGDQ